MGESGGVMVLGSCACAASISSRAFVYLSIVALVGSRFEDEVVVVVVVEYSGRLR